MKANITLCYQILLYNKLHYFPLHRKTSVEKIAQFVEIPYWLQMGKFYN